MGFGPFVVLETRAKLLQSQHWLEVTEAFHSFELFRPPSMGCSSLPKLGLLQCDSACGRCASQWWFVQRPFMGNQMCPWLGNNPSGFWVLETCQGLPRRAPECLGTRPEVASESVKARAVPLVLKSWFLFNYCIVIFYAYIYIYTHTIQIYIYIYICGCITTYKLVVCCQLLWLESLEN